MPQIRAATEIPVVSGTIVLGFIHNRELEVSCKRKPAKSKK